METLYVKSTEEILQILEKRRKGTMQGQGFGLAHLKKEGAPLHPDDMYCATEEQYAKQLKAYNEYYGITPSCGCVFCDLDICNPDRHVRKG